MIFSHFGGTNNIFVDDCTLCIFNENGLCILVMKTIMKPILDIKLFCIKLKIVLDFMQVFLDVQEKYD